MRIVFRRLFRIRVRHGWYPDGVVRGDFEVVPTPSTDRLLLGVGLRTRPQADGITVFGEVEPDTTPPVLLRPLGTASLRLAFELRARTPHLLNIAELPAFAPARTLFCFDNLRADVAAGRKYLGDTAAGARIGSAVTLVTGIYTHRLGAPAAAATITVRNRFGAAVATIDARSPDRATPQAEYRIDFATLPGIGPGRYEIADDRGGTAPIYYDSELAPSRPFAVIEIFSRTDDLTPDQTDRVPASHRFVAGSTLAGLDAYVVEFDPLATTWRYIVTKKYANNGIALNQLSIEGPIAFSRTVTGDRAVFTSNAAVRLSAARRDLTLIRHPNREVRELPNPGLTTPLGPGAAPASYVSDMFVYV